MESLLFVAESESEQRLGERLARLGIPLELVAAPRLATPQRGERFILTAERAANSQLEAITSAGGHLCVVPPWSANALSLKYSSIAPVATARRDPIQLDPSLAAILPTSDQANHLLTIAYREHLPGLAGKALGVSLGGEIVLLALPRVSNLHGYLIVTTLLVGQPSAQTVTEDVVKLFQMLAAWMDTHSDRRANQERSEQTIPLSDPEAERHAQIVLLALVLSQAEHQINTSLLPSTTISITVVQLLAEQIAAILGLPLSPASFQHGWQTLTRTGILLPSGQRSLDGPEEGAIFVDWVKATERINTWQLGPRLRRLRQRVSNVANLH